MNSVALWKYLGVLGTLLAAGMGLPIPEEAPIIGAGVMVGSDSAKPTEIEQNGTLVANPEYEQRARWWIMLPTCIIGVVVGDGILYTIGRLFGYRVLNIRWIRTRLLTPEKRERIERNFHRYGIWILLGARLLPGIRSPIFLMAGINRLPLSRFLLADGLYAIPGVSALFFLAYYFQATVEQVFEKVQSYQHTIVLCVIAAIAGYTLRYFQEHPVSMGDPEEVPVIGHKLATSMMQHGDDGQVPPDTSGSPPAATQSGTAQPANSPPPA